MGCFTLVDVKEGQQVWLLDPRIDRFLSSITGPHFTFLDVYTYRDTHTGLWVLCADNARFINHGDTPNLRAASTPEFRYGSDVAMRDIAAGEELTIDYAAIHNGSWKRDKPSA